MKGLIYYNRAPASSLGNSFLQIDSVNGDAGDWHHHHTALTDRIISFEFSSDMLLSTAIAIRTSIKRRRIIPAVKSSVMRLPSPAIPFTELNLKKAVPEGACRSAVVVD